MLPVGWGSFPGLGLPKAQCSAWKRFPSETALEVCASLLQDLAEEAPEPAEGTKPPQLQAGGEFLGSFLGLHSPGPPSQHHHPISASVRVVPSTSGAKGV